MIPVMVVMTLLIVTTFVRARPGVLVRPGCEGEQTRAAPTFPIGNIVELTQALHDVRETPGEYLRPALEKDLHLLRLRKLTQLSA